MSTKKATASSPVSQLGSLLDGAGRAFVNHDYRLTQSLVDSAFDILHPPTSIPDTLDELRCRWEVFRITLETHVYTTSSVTDDLPSYLKEILVQSSQTLITAMYQRSLLLFSPANTSSKAINVVHVPPSVVSTLVFATLKVNCPDVGRMIIEEWLARRDAYTFPGRNEAYRKLLAIYCLQILPALDLWEYAQEFLDYESEMSHKSREHLRKALNDAYNKAKATEAAPTPTPSAPGSPRSQSPALSSSSSSSLSTTSTHTAVPNRVTRLLNTSASTESVSSSATARPRSHSRRRALTPDRKEKSPARSSTSYSAPHAALVRAHSSPVAAPATASAQTPGFLALVKASISPLLSSSRVVTLLIFGVVFPLISMVVRLRRRGAGGPSASTVDAVRKRLQGVSGAEAGLFSRAVGEVLRIVSDTVRMAGSGLV